MIDARDQPVAYDSEVVGGDNEDGTTRRRQMGRCRREGEVMRKYKSEEVKQTAR